MDKEKNELQVITGTYQQVRRVKSLGMILCPCVVSVETKYDRNGEPLKPIVTTCGTPGYLVPHSKASKCYKEMHSIVAYALKHDEVLFLCIFTRECLYLHVLFSKRLCSA